MLLPTELYWLVLMLSILVGSFHSRIIYRLPPNIDSSINAYAYLCSPKSHCPLCQHNLKIWHTIPLLSFIALKGRCYFCHARISGLYPLTESLTTVLTYFCLTFYGVTLQALSLCLFFLFSLPLIIIDFKHYLLPDTLNYLLLWLGLLQSTAHVFCSPTSAIIGSLSGYGLLYIPAKIMGGIKKQSVMGHGDFKLCAALGAWLGLANIIYLILMAAIIGIIASLPKLIQNKTTQFVIPFGPCLIVAAVSLLIFKGTG